METVRIYVGYDPREAVVYHTFCESVLNHSSIPVSFHPLSLSYLGSITGRRDASNDFGYSRFLVPWLCKYNGWALYADGDMVFKADVAELYAMREQDKDVMVCKHVYETKAESKYLGSKNESYPRKCWSALILWNCVNNPNRRLTPEYVAEHDGAHLHRFSWLKDERIGELPLEWGWLDTEYNHNPDAKLVHYTLGAPCFPEYKDCDHSSDWRQAHYMSQRPLNSR
jgi:hypothetical protein